MAKNELAIMKRGKRTVAHYVKSECLMKAPGQPQLAALLNFLLDCNKSVDDYDTLDWCKWLISGGETFDEFAKTGKTLICSIRTLIIMSTLITVDTHKTTKT